MQLSPEGIFELMVNSPSFDWNHCQLTHIELVLPTNLPPEIKYALTATVQFGKVVVADLSNPLDSLDAYARFGHVKVHDVEVENSLIASARVGAVKMARVAADAVIAEVATGGMHVKHVTANSGVARVETGYAKLNNWAVRTMFAWTEFGYLGMHNFPQNDGVTASVDYGKLSYVPHSDFSGHVTMESPYGFLHFDQASKVDEPLIQEQTPAKVDALFQYTTMEADMPEHNFNSIYGSIKFFVPNPSRYDNDDEETMHAMED
jgi:hypothetical protein